MKARTGVELSAIIIRACSLCGGKRELRKQCASCGNPEPAKAVDLGIIAARNRSRWKNLKWKLWGYHAAQRRIRKANKENREGVVVSPTTST
jgi:hypothetical protein